MIAPGAGMRVYLACGVTDMRRGITGPAAQAQQVDTSSNRCGIGRFVIHSLGGRNGVVYGGS